MFLANVRLNGRTILAPLAGVSDSSFRLICKQNGVALVFSEMVSSEGLVRNDRKSNQYLEFLEEERPIGMQLFGSNPDVMAEAAKIVEQKKPDFIDLNFGCPVKKVVKKGAGSAILKDMKLLRKITQSVVMSTSTPVTVKIRSGWNTSQINAIEVAKILEDCGVSAVTIHPRTQTQYFKNHSDWNIIREVKQAVTIPVIGNGDIYNCYDAKQMIDETDCDFIMIGRGVLGNPLIFNQINTHNARRTTHSASSF